MNRTRALPSAVRCALLPAIAGLILMTGCSDESDAATADSTGAPTTTAETVAETASETSSEADEETSGDTSTESADTESDGTTTTTDSAAAVNNDLDLGGVGPLESSTVHSLSVEFDQGDYEAMIDTYTATEEKEWIEATVTIDGTTYEQVGMRLKGNSSLRGIAGRGGGGPMGDEGASPEDPETLPWLIDLDKFVDGQNHDGLTEFVVRSNGSETSLNEALALELLDLAGLASQDAVATAFSVNGSDEILRLVIDNPDDQWMAEVLDSTGALYKAESTGDYSYRGDDPESYTEVFDQEAGKDNADLTALIEFLQFINESDDATFEAELADHLDVDSFATYLAMQDLLANFDDIDGPGNNSYLFYDPSTEQFTVVPWDYNLAFGMVPGGGAGGPGRAGGPGGGRFPGGEMPQPPADGGQFPAGEMPQPPGDFGGVPGGMPGGGPGGGNVLVERFLAVDEWQALYDTRLAELRADLYDSGLADRVLQTWVDVVMSSGLVDESTVTAEADRIAQQLD